MSYVRHLITEIHRRSLWQVLAIFIAAGWAVLQVLDVLIQNGMLPDWVFKAGVVLLLLGLPVVLATAFVQEGLPGGSDSNPQPPSHPAARSPDDAAARSSGDVDPLPPGGVSALLSGPSISPAGETDPVATMAAATPAERSPSGARSRSSFRAGAHHRLFTWRNALLGGVAAFTLLGIVSAGYMAMRSLGIGAPGTLLAQGVIEKGAPVLLAEFESGADADLGGVVTRTLRVDLQQSPAIQLLEPADLRSALQRAQLPDSATLTPVLARQLAEREGYAAVIAGAVAPVGTGYVLTASILGGDGFRSLASFREMAKSEAQLVDAIERLSRSMRDKIGESLRSIRGGPPLAQVTTRSLEALRAYTRAEQLEWQGNLPAALEHYERAVAHDSTFAMGHRKVAVALANMRIRPADAIRASRRTYELRDRLPDLERHVAVGWYHRFVSGDIDAAVNAYEQAMTIDSSDMPLLNGLGNMYTLQGRNADAARAFRRGLQKGSSVAIWWNLATTRFRSGDLRGALATVDSGRVALPDWSDAHHLAAQFLGARGDYTAADSLTDLLEAEANTPLERAFARLDRYLLAATRGRLREAERVLAAPGAQLFMADSIELAFRRAQVSLQRGDTAGAVQMMVETAKDPEVVESPNVAELIAVLAEAGAAQPAAELLRRWEAAAPGDQLGIFGRASREAAQGQVARLQGDFDAALRALDGLRRWCPGCGAIPSYEIARAYDAMGQAERAIAEYERSLAENDPSSFGNGVLQTPHTLRRLAELYDARGDTQKAATYYAKFIELWKDADPELQPQVRKAQTRLASLLPDRR